MKDQNFEFTSTGHWVAFYKLRILASYSNLKIGQDSEIAIFLHNVILTMAFSLGVFWKFYEELFLLLDWCKGPSIKDVSSKG